MHDDVSAALKITPQFYEAAIDPGKWPSVLGLMCERFDALNANINFGKNDLGSDNLTVYFSAVWPGDEALMKTYLAFSDLVHGDPRFEPGRMYPNRPWRRPMLASDEDWYSSPIYRQVFEPHGIDDTLAAFIVEEGVNVGLGIGFMRPPGRPFDDADVEHLQLYIPHLRGACRLALKHFVENNAVTALTAALDALALGGLVVDRHGMIDFENAAARELCAAGDAVVRAGGRLSARDPDVDAALRAAILEVATASPETKERRHLVLPRASGDAGLMATIAPVSNPGLGGDRTAAPPNEFAIVFLNDPLQSYETPRELLQRLYGLTEAEAEVAQRFARGEEARAIAEATGRSYETVRWHLKQLMAKVGVTRQAELMHGLAAARTPLRS